MRVMLDTNIFDRIVATWGLTREIRRLVKSGALTTLTTHIQEDELAKAPLWKRVRFARVPRVRVATSDFVIGHSRFDQARLGAGERLEEIRGTAKHTNDGLIAATALAESAALITEERRLTLRASDAGVTVWDFGRFRAWVESTPPRAPSAPSRPPK